MTKEDRAFGIRLFHAVSVIIQRFALVALPVADDGANPMFDVTAVRFG